MAKLSASLIIVTLNRAESLARTLASLDQIRYAPFEVIVVNGPSTDSTAQVIARHAPRLRAFTTVHANISISRNIGLCHARGDIVAFIDDDAIPEPDWLENLLAPYADSRVACVGGFIRDATGFGFQARYTLCNRFGDAQQFADPQAFTLGPETFLALTGTNFSARRETLLALGGFDEEYIWFLDETDVNLRMHDQGLGFAVAPDAEIHHKSEAGLTRTGTDIPRTMYPQLRSKAYFALRHNLGRKPLADILRYLAQYIAKERAWKRELPTDEDTIARLIDEVERGARDGVADAMRLPRPARLKARASEGAFAPFAPKLPAERRLRLCLLSREYPPEGHGGIGQWTREVATGLAARGHEVTVLSRAQDGPPRIDFTDGVWVHRLAPTPLEEDQARALAPAPAALAAYALALHREIQRIDARRRFDLISGPIADLEPLACLRFSPLPVVVSLHTTYKLSLPFKPDWLSRPEYLQDHVAPTIEGENALLRSSPHLLANSRTILSDIEAAHGVKIDRRKVEIIPHGINDLAEGAPPAPPEAGVVKLLFVGRLEARKGADVLLTILPALLAEHPELQADLVGYDEIPVGGKTLRQRYEEDHADALARTRFHGVLAREQVLAHYAACDIFIAPSKYESFGLVFIEAMCFAKPIVAYDVGGAAEVMRHGVDGWLAPVDDPAALAQAVSRLVRDSALRAELGANARRSYEARYTTPLMLDRLEFYYRGVIADHATAPPA